MQAGKKEKRKKERKKKKEKESTEERKTNNKARPHHHNYHLHLDPRHRHRKFKPKNTHANFFPFFLSILHFFKLYITLQVPAPVSSSHPLCHTCAASLSLGDVTRNQVHKHTDGPCHGNSRRVFLVFTETEERTVRALLLLHGRN